MTPHFWRRVTKGDGCWVWTGYRSRSGYGRLSYRGRPDSAHRIAWTFTFGPIPDGLRVLHRCDNRACCNPAHLFLGTQADNMRDMDAKGRRRWTPRPGEENTAAKLTWAEVAEIRRRYVPQVVTLTELGTEFGVSAAQIHRIVTGRAWVESGVALATIERALR